MARSSELILYTEATSFVIIPSCKKNLRFFDPRLILGRPILGVGHGPVEGWGMVQWRGGAWSSGGVGHGPVDKAPGCCKVALGSNPRPSTPKMVSSKVDEQLTGGPTKIRG